MTTHVNIYEELNPAEDVNTSSQVHSDKRFCFVCVYFDGHQEKYRYTPVLRVFGTIKLEAEFTPHCSRHQRFVQNVPQQY